VNSNTKSFFMLSLDLPYDFLSLLLRARRGPLFRNCTG
jgi:hypothetical protein